MVKYPWNSGILWYNQDYPRFPPAIDYSGKVSLESWDTLVYSGLSQDSTRIGPHGKVSLESWDTLVYSGLSQDSTSYELCFLVIYCCTYMNIYKPSLHTYVRICPLAMCSGC